MEQNANEAAPQNLELQFMDPVVKGNLKSAMKVAGASSADLWSIPPDCIEVIRRYNIREIDEDYEAKVESLTRSMLDPTVGFKRDTPLSVIVVREDGKDVIRLKSGHRRLEAAKRAIARGATFKVVYAVVSTNTSEEEMLADLHRDNDSDKLQPYELAKLAKLMSVYIEKPSDIAKKLVLDAGYVQDLLMLIDGPFAIREYVRKRTITATFAIDTMKQYGNKAVDIVEQALLRARAKGSKSVSAKHVPGALVKKAITRAAPQMRTAIASVKTDPAYAQLAPETRTTIDAIFDALKAAENEEHQLAEKVASADSSGQESLAA
ncbi:MULTISPECIES: hypothetical protein [Caballeronia]|uniref:hypothetical protein n=1 Tax=Caballeronia TaxID=1827195 RepID=UPI001FD25A7F|nr:MULTISPECIES: hypothetical protein [Caballeronia]MDR5798925.1 hypothetical protein [Caballeronia sp. LZ001]